MVLEARLFRSAWSTEGKRVLKTCFLDLLRVYGLTGREFACKDVFSNLFKALQSRPTRLNDAGSLGKDRLQAFCTKEISQSLDS